MGVYECWRLCVFYWLMLRLLSSPPRFALCLYFRIWTLCMHLWMWFCDQLRIVWLVFENLYSNLQRYNLSLSVSCVCVHHNCIFNHDAFLVRDFRQNQIYDCECFKLMQMKWECCGLKNSSHPMACLCLEKATKKPKKHPNCRPRHWLRRACCSTA